LFEEKTYNTWQLENFPNNKINVISFNIWDSIFEVYFYQKDFRDNWNIDSIVARFRETKSKNFLCLNRRKRNFRLVTIYNILKSSILNQTLLSKDSILDEQQIMNLSSWTSGHQRKISYDELSILLGQARILDEEDFEVNWAITMPGSLFDSSLISTVSETQYDTFNLTNLFYSEKTFKPMMYLQPIFIFGQPGINTYLENLGYRTYNNYFDLSFDTIENPIDRLTAQIKQLEILNDKLNSMSVEKKIEWYLQDRETLEHNKQMMLDQKFNIEKFTQFMKMLDLLSQ
jgi:hypothetical protein